MKDYLKNLPVQIKGLVCLARDISADSQMPAYLVGGIVRDLILGAENFDLDIVVEGNGIKFAQDFAARLKGKIVCHSRFGTATLTIPGNLKVDIATARREFYPAAAHLPHVSFGSIRDDLYRRDFTINAMAVSISGNTFGGLIDLFGAADDLGEKKIKVLHDASFIDDPTRILRAIRFEQRYGFRIEAHTLAMFKKAVRAKMLERVQPQRLRDELVLIFKERHPLKCLKRMRELSGFGFIYPGLSLSAKTSILLAAAKRQISWFQRKYPMRRGIDTWLVYFIALLDELKSVKVRKICRAFGFRRGEEKRILSHKSIGKSFLSRLGNKELNPAQVFRLLEPLSYEVILLIKAKYKDNVAQKHIRDFFEIYNGIRLVVRGNDLSALGLEPGPCYQKVFSRALRAKLEGKVKTKEEELKFIKKIIGRK